MFQLLLRWLLNTLALLVVAHFVPGIYIDSFYHALMAALVLGLVNALIRPFVFLLTLPVTILTLGIFALVINALMILLAGSIVKGFVVAGFAPAFFAAILLWLMSFITNAFIKTSEY